MASLNNFVVTYGIVGSVCFILLWALRCKLKSIKQRMFAFVVDRYMSQSIEKEFVVFKEKLFSHMNTMVSYDPRLKTRGQGVIRVLEIGVGSGVNLKYYPIGCRFICVEPNPYFETYFKKNSEKFRHIEVEQFVTAMAENMAEIPENSVDAVVSTCVLCSVMKIQDVLQEIKRVLVPGGKFLYFEHIGYDRKTWKRFAQRIMEPLFMFTFENCQLTLDTAVSVRKAGFTDVSQSVVDIDGLCFLYRRHVIGIATK
ncbi:thiol S-methyltransferase TMT1A-like [Tachypleus tridentatus]|uniref:thiol S-methyltransferase TMT1A-like n=1 Tax=Tachypleus tridentatus TaxID=6853 RepID=UPI003FCF0022